MASGTVKWFNATKGFGFIQPDNGGKDVFVHISAVERAGLNGLNEGQKITYDVVNERGKDAAANLKVITRANTAKTPPGDPARGFLRARCSREAAAKRESLRLQFPQALRP